MNLNQNFARADRRNRTVYDGQDLRTAAIAVSDITHGSASVSVSVRGASAPIVLGARSLIVAGEEEVVSVSVGVSGKNELRPCVSLFGSSIVLVLVLGVLSANTIKKSSTRTRTIDEP